MTEGHYVFDADHDRLKPGMVVLAKYRGHVGPFVVLADLGTGLLQLRDPAGKERPMRPSTMLACAIEIGTPAELGIDLADFDEAFFAGLV